MKRCVPVLSKIALVGVVWETVAVCSSGQSHVPHFWQLLDAVATFGRFGDKGDVSLREAMRVLTHEALRSVMRAMLGLILGCAGGYFIGAATMLLPGWQAVPTKLTSFLRSIPPLALVFLLMFLSPAASITAVFYISICVCLLIGGTLQDSNRYMPEHLLIQVSNLGGSWWNQLRDVAMPSMWIQTKETMVWVARLLLPLTFGAELINSQSGGLGGLSYRAFIYSNLSQLMTLAIVYICLGNLLNYFASILMNDQTQKSIEL